MSKFNFKRFGSRLAMDKQVSKPSFGASWHREGKIGSYDILQGAGTAGGLWAAKGRGEFVCFTSRSEAEDHAEFSQEM